MANNTEQSMMDRQLSRLIIENQSEDGSIDISDQGAMKDEILQLIEAEATRARIDELENVWACQNVTETGVEIYVDVNGEDVDMYDRIAELKRQAEGGIRNERIS